LHIKRIEIKNWLGIKELMFSPGKVNKVSGDSATGKTSLVEAMEKLFTNKNRRTEVIRHDEEEAELFVELDDGLQTTRKIRNEKADYLKVKHDSKAVASTEAFLKKLINGDVFRPIEFVQKTPTEQAKIILNMLDIDWSVENIKSWFDEVPEADYQLHILQILKQIENRYYVERESINREINLLKANVEGIKGSLPANYDGAEWKTVNLQTLYNKLSEVEAINKKLEEAQSLIEGLNIRIDDIKKRAENARESKRLDYNRQRDMLENSIKNINGNILVEQEKVADVDRKISEENIRLDNQLQQEIERLKIQFQAKKQMKKDEIQLEAEQAKAYINEYSNQLSENTNKLLNISEHEKKDVERIDDHEAQQIELEKTKSGNAQGIVKDAEKIDVEPLKIKADNAANMKEYLREWERMNDIIREKLSPKELRSGELTAKIEKARELPNELLKTASLPIEGLEVDEKGRIRIGGTLIDGLSEGEKLDFAFRLAQAQAGDLKVICVDGWQGLGSKQHEIMESAVSDEYQYFILDTVDGQDFKIEIVEAV